MTQTDLDCAVARATGESLSTIRRLGFGVADPAIVCHDPEPAAPQVVDWDELDARRVAYLSQRSRWQRRAR